VSQRVCSVEQVKAMARRRRTPKDVPPRYAAATGPIHIRLSFPPRANTYYRSVTINGHSRMLLSREGRQYRNCVRDLWAKKASVTFFGLVALRVDATYPDHRRRDIDGLFKALLDSLEYAGAMEDDSQVRLLLAEHVGTRKPGWLEVTIEHKAGGRQGELF